MARGDECKTANKANYACKSFDVAAPMKKPASPTYQVVKQQEQKKDYGSWGPVFKDKKTFTDMHLC